MGSNCPPPTIRDSVVRKIVSLLRDNLTESSVAISFLLGRTSYLSRELKTQAKELGVLHVFAASGMHLAVLYGVVMIPLSRFPGKKHPITAIIAFVPCLFYCWLLGFPISLTRALGFVIMYTLGILLSRRITTGDLILNTAMLLLIWMPSEMLTLSSVLSFGAVIGILFFYEPLCRLFFFKSYKMEILWKKMALPVSASLFTIPVISIVFHSHSFSSTIINLLIVPLADLLLPILFMALAVESLSIPAKAIWLVADHGIKLFVQLTESLSVASLYQESDAGTTLPLVCSICLLILLLHAKFFPGACGPVLVVCRRVVLILVMLIGPLGAGVMEIQSRLSARSIENSGSKERLLAEKESSD